MGLPSLRYNLNSNSRTYSYQAFGLNIVSTVACPELFPQPGAPDVCVHYGVVPDALEIVQRRETFYELNAEEFLLRIPAIAKFLVLGGKEIIVEPAPGVPDHEVRPFLLGSAFGALFHQRGLLPLHGSAIEVNGGAVVFLGASGSGKSSLAAAFSRRGYRVITDDVSVLSFSPEGKSLVHHSCQHLKLSAEILEGMGKKPAAYPRVIFEPAKYLLPLRDGFCASPRPVKRVYELATHDTQDFQIALLQGTEKLTVLLSHTYRPEFLEGSPGKKLYFTQCSRAARHTAISRLLRPRWPFRLDKLVELLEQGWVLETK
jgi:hypothetical protein